MPHYVGITYGGSIRLKKDTNPRVHDRPQYMALYLRQVPMRDVGECGRAFLNTLTLFVLELNTLLGLLN